MPADGALQWTSAARSHPGLVRGKNEDALLDQAGSGRWAVADGMGGHARGDLASRAVVDALGNLPAAETLMQSLADAKDQLRFANRQLRAEAAARGVPIVGSTVAALFACGASCGCLWAGDSRIYLYRSGVLTQLTRDHSKLEEFRQQSLAGGDAVIAPPRNAITRAVGAADTLELDEELLDAHAGDVFLLCSDGLSNAVDEEAIRKQLAGGDCALAVDALIGLALQAGGRDNISIVVVRADDLLADEKTVLNPAL